ncbi:HK97-gp10 family putative phage morphogenesis protein [Pseudoglutamicibacter cumminsii]|uniref:HK97-gp10 family putative phage morphogenesis protein n=1 Tax=Pseudoglutamicibacter cumminsii TaxID=156979 RepID=UPI00195B8252|nr:HK97-gp10 family putative phage morphogenesis protein [Pseudoglutamicibacter cumminsii]MBM7796882.1 HK97 gp10 family phage protein [Pseudoglutamicibacter cumminsii]
MRIETKGLDKAARKLSPRDAHQIAGRVTEVAAVQLYNTAKTRTPVDTGHLRDSATWEADTSSGVMAARVEYGADYAYWVEHGTSRMPARRFVASSLEDVAPKYHEQLLRALRAGLVKR